MELIGGALKRSQIIAQGPRNSLLQCPLERLFALYQGILCPLGIMETGQGGCQLPFTERVPDRVEASSLVPEAQEEPEVSLAFPTAGSYLRESR